MAIAGKEGGCKWQWTTLASICLKGHMLRGGRHLRVRGSEAERERERDHENEIHPVLVEMAFALRPIAVYAAQHSTAQHSTAQCVDCCIVVVSIRQRSSGR